MKVSTKAKAGGTPVVTNLTITGGSPATWQALGMQALVVKLQGGWRKNGIPATFTCKVDEFAPGTRHTGTSDPVELYKAMSTEERKAYLANLAKLG